MKSFLFLLSLPSETVRAVSAMASESAQRVRIRKVIQANRPQILRMLEDTVLDQINSPRELASIHQGPGGESASVVTRMKASANDLPETHDIPTDTEGGE